MTFDEYLRPDLLSPPTWYESARVRPPIGIDVMVRRDADSQPDIDRAIEIEWSELDEATGRWVRRREWRWCGTPRGRVCLGPEPPSYWPYWASAVWSE